MFYTDDVIIYMFFYLFFWAGGWPTSRRHFILTVCLVMTLVYAVRVLRPEPQALGFGRDGLNINLEGSFEVSLRSGIPEFQSGLDPFVAITPRETTNLRHFFCDPGFLGFPGDVLRGSLKADAGRKPHSCFMAKQRGVPVGHEDGYKICLRHPLAWMIPWDCAQFNCYERGGGEG